MLTAAQLQKIWLLSDTVLYPEAVAFVSRVIRQEEHAPLPNAQAASLMGVAELLDYGKLEQFMKHQADRGAQKFAPFYTELEKHLSLIGRSRLKDEFHLLADDPARTAKATREETRALLALVAREFIQHLLAENGLQVALNEEQQRPLSKGRRNG